MKMLLLGVMGGLPPIVAQLPMADEAWKLALQSGFNAVLVLLLLWIGRAEIRSIMSESKETTNRMNAAIDRNTRAINQTVLAMAFLPKQFHTEAEKVSEEVREAEHDRNHPQK